ncbi:hypothetical protein R1sor_012289 [Riccia sorocarpa]|uniref:Jacalin-type lectin domain-containing protein n=1 Tax=Riccia sorocarpa TaxID=122646 RepID=A0ABD3I3P8_9MARC
MSQFVHTPVRVIGSSSGGNPFSTFGGSDGRIVERILVYSGGWQIKAITVWLTNSRAVTFGNPSGNTGSREFVFQNGERITSLSLWGNGAGTRAGWIRFKTSTNRVFDFGMTDWGRREEFPVDVGSGIFIGLQGRANLDVDALGFIFLKHVVSARVVDVRYPTLALDLQAGIRSVTLQGFSSRNNNTNGQPTNWRFEGSRTVTESSSWSNTTALSFHVGWNVEASIPFVASVGGSGGWELSNTFTRESTTSSERSLTWDQSGTLNPGQSVSLAATTKEGILNIDYEGAFEVVLRDGNRFRYSFSGTYDGTSFTTVDVILDGTRRSASAPKAPEQPEVSHEPEVLDLFEL